MTDVELLMRLWEQVDEAERQGLSGPVIITTLRLLAQVLEHDAETKAKADE
jgi:hypothetical protein